MATIRPQDLSPAGTVSDTAAIIVDGGGAALNKATPAQVVDAAIPLASQGEAEAGTNNAKRVTPLRVKQAIAALGSAKTDFPNKAAIAAAPVSNGKATDLSTGTTYFYTATDESANSLAIASDDVGYWKPVAKEIISVRDFGAKIENADNTLFIQTALDYAATRSPVVVAADQGQYITDEVEVPSDVEFRCNLKIKTPATAFVERNVVIVNDRSSVVGRIEGSNTTDVEVVERGIFTNAEGVSDVTLDVTVTKVTVGVQPYSSNLANPPKRWSGNVRCTDIAGKVPAPNGNGYGLNGTLCDSNLTIFCDNVPRHGLYLAAGASRNEITLYDKGGRFAPLDIACFDSQPECYGNVIRAFVTDHKADYPGAPHAGGFISGNCRGNIVEIHVSDSAPLTNAFFLQANTPGAAPKDNKVTVYFDGQIKGSSIVDAQSASGTRLKVYGTGSGVNADFRTIVYIGNNGVSPDAPRAVVCEVDDIDFVSTGNIAHAVVNAQNYGLVDIGECKIKAAGLTGNVVNFFSFGEFLVGWVYKTDFVGTTGMVASGATGGLAVTFNQPLPQRRYISYSVAPLSDPGTFAPNHYIQPILDGSCSIKVKNNDTIAQNFIVSGRAYGF